MILFLPACYIGPIEVLDMSNHPPELLLFAPITEDGVVVLETGGTDFWVQVRDESPDDLAYLWYLSESGPQDYAQPIESEYDDIGGSKLTLPFDADFDGQTLIAPIHDEESDVEVTWFLEVVE